MTRSQWWEIVARIRSCWPQAELPDEALAFWFDDLKHEPVEQVHAAVMTAYRDGDAWPPNGAQILHRLAELRVNAPPFDRVWQLGHIAAHRFGRRRAHDAHGWLTEQAGELAANLIVDDWYGFCDGASNDRTRFAQTRDLYAERKRRAITGHTYQGIPGADLPALERPVVQLAEGGR